jgi:hypothetical protein
MTQDKLIVLSLSGACAAVAGLMMLTASPPPSLSQPPAKRCVAISKGEYDGAKRDKLLHAAFGAYVKTGWPRSHAYWHCRD